jgi:hypothetical protein
MKHTLISAAVQAILAENKPIDPPIDLAEKKWKKVEGHHRLHVPITKPVKIIMNGMPIETWSVTRANLHRLWLRGLLTRFNKTPVPAKRRFLMN